MARMTNVEIAKALVQHADVLQALHDGRNGDRLDIMREAASRLRGYDPVPVGHYPPDQKYGPALVFDKGSLYVKQQGYGEENGNGEFVFCLDESNGLDVIQEEGKDYLIVPVHRTDLLFLRDHLNKMFPPPECHCPACGCIHEPGSTFKAALSGKEE